MTYFLQAIRTSVSHNKDFLYGGRGFNSIEEHDAMIIENWNKIVKPNNIVYHLGDVFLNSEENGIQCLNQLNGTIYWVRGNHDTEGKIERIRTECPNIRFAGTLAMEPLWATVLDWHKWRFYLSHYPTQIGDFVRDDRKRYCLCGHVHTQDRFLNIMTKTYHVEVDAHNLMPVNIEEIREDLINYRQSI